MENKHVGFLILGIAAILTVIILLFQNALKQANVGIAMGTGTDIAIETGDIVLVNGSLEGVVSSVKLSKATFRKIKQNLFWAFAYNTIAIPVAVIGLLHPIFAELAMAFSSISVVANANLLRRAKI